MNSDRGSIPANATRRAHGPQLAGEAAEPRSHVVAGKQRVRPIEREPPRLQDGQERHEPCEGLGHHHWSPRRAKAAPIAPVITGISR
jgi:hypothetical protein